MIPFRIQLSARARQQLRMERAELLAMLAELERLLGARVRGTPPPGADRARVDVVELELPLFRLRATVLIDALNRVLTVDALAPLEG